MSKNQLDRLFLGIVILSIALTLATMVYLLTAAHAQSVVQNQQAAVIDQTSSTVEMADKQESATEESQDVKETQDEREAYVAEWATRIDAFNEGYPLAGYGRVFAEAAYDTGVDPRFSPAIARVESGSGEVCAYSYNAWGWGEQSWDDWESAIRAHVEGLAQNYGTEPTYDIALAYNSSTPDEWYEQVTACMEQI